MADFADMIGEPLLPWQRWAVIHALELLPGGDYRFRIVIIVVARQNGKALDCDVDILTANRGWTTMGELAEGDEVFHPDGHPVRVIAAHPVRRGRDCYRVTTTDGRSVIADAGHLWTVQDVRRYTRKGGRAEKKVRTYTWETLTTAQLLGRGLMRDARECAYRLPRQYALISKPASLPLDPYLLGMWLGDGNSRGATISAGSQDVEQTVAAVEQCGARIVSLRRDHTAWRIHFSIAARRSGYGFESLCKKLGIWGNKHVPELYLTAGTEQRLALLQGLLDSDGSIYIGGGGSARVEFCVVNRQLADSALYLIRSLGWRATLIEARATIAGRDCGPKYRVCFTPEQGELVPFRLRRKAEKIQAPRSRSNERHAVSIRSIEPVETRPVRCITVDREDGQFLAGRELLATHNSTVKRAVTLWRMYMQPKCRILGIAQDLSLAREQWQMCQDTIHETAALEEEWGRVRNVNGDEMFWTANGSRYAIKAPNRKAGRGGSNDEVNIDELAQHYDWKSWAATSKTTMAKANSQIWAMSNAGDDNSVVLNQLRDAALTGRDETIGLFEWSGEYGEDGDTYCDIDDWAQIAQANPSLGYKISASAVRTAMADPPEIYRTENLCQRVRSLNTAIDMKAWGACADPAVTMDSLRDRLAACFDVADDDGHATLAVAAKTPEGKVRGEIAASWPSVAAARLELAPLLERIKPSVIAWYPSGPAASLAPVFRAPKGRPVKLADAAPGRPHYADLTGGDVCEVCMGLASLVKGRMILHSNDPLLNAHLGGASRMKVGGRWRFARKLTTGKDASAGPEGAEGEDEVPKGHVDAAYAFAGAVHEALLLPEPRRARIRMLSA